MKKIVGLGEEADFIGVATLYISAKGVSLLIRKKSSARRTIWLEVIFYGRRSIRVEIPAIRGSLCLNCGERRWCISVAVVGIKKKVYRMLDVGEC